MILKNIFIVITTLVKNTSKAQKIHRIKSIDATVHHNSNEKMVGGDVPGDQKSGKIFSKKPWRG